MNELTMTSKKKSKVTCKTKENEHITTQNLWGTSKAAPCGKFIALQAYLKKQEKSQGNNLTLHLKELEKEQQTKPRVSRRKKIIKIRAEINDIEIKKKKRQKVSETKSWLSEKIKKINTHLIRFIKKKRERT